MGYRPRVTSVAIVGLLLVMLTSEAASQTPTVTEPPPVIEGRVLCIDFGGQTLAGTGQRQPDHHDRPSPPSSERLPRIPWERVRAGRRLHSPAEPSDPGIRVLPGEPVVSAEPLKRILSPTNAALETAVSQGAARESDGCLRSWPRWSGMGYSIT